MTAQAKIVKEILSDHSVVWNVEYKEGTLNLTIGCTNRHAAELLVACLNDDVAWINADVGETV